jgi:HlyD family secretion protein
MCNRDFKIACIGLAGLLALAGCAAKATDPAAHPAAPAAGRKFAAIPVQAVTVHVGALTAKNQTAGSVVPVTQSSVASQVSGVVARLRHLAGDWVKEGETIVQLDDSQLKLSLQIAQSGLQNAKINYAIGLDNANQSNPKLALQVQSAQSALASAQKTYDSQKALLDIGGISASQLDTASSNLQQAQANLEAARTALDQNQKSDTQTLAQLKLAIDQAQNQVLMAQLNLQNAAIKAPFAGQVAAVNVNPGMYVGLNTPVFILVSADRQITFNVPPSDAPTLAPGSAVSFTYLGKDYAVQVSQAPSAPIGGVVPIVANVPRSISLPFGTVGTVTYTLSLAKGALVQIASLEVNEDQNYVYVIADGKAATRNVTILGESGTTAAVVGVDEGTQVIVNPPPGLLAGAAVHAVAPAGSASAAATAGGQGPAPAPAAQGKNQ